MLLLLPHRGGAVSEGDGFEEFANDIGTIQTGGDLESFITGTSTSVTYEGEIVRDCAFAGMSDLEEVNLPNATYIGYSACSDPMDGSYMSDASEGDINFNNHKLQVVNIPKVTNILHHAFTNCIGLTSINLPSTLIRIGMAAFKGSGLSQINIPNSVLYINEEAFHGCLSLTNITFNNSFTVIGESAFYGCVSLNRIMLPTTLNSLAKSAFNNCSSLDTIDLTAYNSTDTPLALTGPHYIGAFANISSNAKFYFKDQATLDNFATDANWAYPASEYTFTTDPVPTPSE